jgi:signal transduction histidine kinase
LVTLQNEVERIGHLVENVFAFARLERGGRPRHCQPSTLKSILDRVERRLHDLAQRSQMQFEVAPDSAWDEWVAVDSSMVEQILVNLVDNACKHAKNDQSPRILLSAHACGRELHVAVRDFGPGIRRPPKRWSPFFKSVEHAADTVHGIGLGLAISQRFAKALGGRLIIDNAEPGARVTLALPMS